MDTKVVSVPRTKEEISQLILEWEQSSLSKKLFCDQKQLNYQTFIGWIIQRRNRASSVEHKFIPIQIEARPTVGLFAEIHLSGSRKVILHQAVNFEFFQAVLKC